MKDSKVHIIGVAPRGADSLIPEAHYLVQRAEMLLGGKRLLDMFPGSPAQKIAVTDNLDEITSLIKSNLGSKRLVVLASGDPNFFGIARHLTESLGTDVIDIIPNVSAVQLAFARIKESWDDAVFVSVHSRPIETVVETVRAHRKVCILTDNKNGPAEIASELQRHGIANCRAYVCQDLGSDKEDIFESDLYSLPEMKFSPLNVVVLVREPLEPEPPQQLLGIPESRFSLRSPQKSLITKLEIRVVSLAKLCLTEESTVWDIGAGSGAVSIEASHLARRGKVFAIEKNAGDIAVIRENMRRFDRCNIEVVQAAAPDGLEGLPDPDAVFVGGSGGRMAEILRLVCRRLKAGGRIVVNLATIERLQPVCDELRENGCSVETTLLNVARSQELLGLTRLEALNPVFIIAGQRKDSRI
ncbi:MAG: precorrin-6y C5,15-methyltransferase (decarboxylating) subunit CbiE [Chloroflexi bacterium]|nr:precorrin-6y C5,15-methyltransferase (decarboxylating) subunit CbiE [Chloroflexota bacterium]